MEIEMDIDMESLGDLSNAFFWEVAEVLNEGLDVTNGRSLICIAGASHANEHWFAVRSVLENDLFSAAVFCHRAQRNALIRAIWHCFNRHSAPDLGINLPIALTQYLQNDLLVSC